LLENTMTGRDDDPRDALLTIRTTLILLLALLAGVGAAVLTALADHSGFEAALVGLGAFAAGIKFFHWLVT
jgi:hypothetical protein